MEIRALTAADVCEYSRLRLESLETEPEAFSSSAESHRALSEDELKGRISAVAGNKFVVGAFADGRLVGTAGFFRDPGLKERHKGHVWGVYVTAAARGKGIGRRLMAALIERARAIDGVEQVVLSVTQGVAAELYRSLGFRSFGVEPRALKIGERYLDEEYMVLRLD